MVLDLQTDANIRLASLTAKEREILDHILLHKPLKTIAYDIDITVSAVDQRLKSARHKLGAADRNEAARIYSALLETCRKSTCGFAELGTDHESYLFRTSEPHSGSTFTFQDSATIDVAPPWLEDGQRSAVSEVLDQRYGRLWRVLAIPVFAVIIAILALALIAMSQALGKFL